LFGWLHCAAVATAAFVASAVVVMLVRIWTTHKQILDHPNERSSHSSPTPRGGGLGIVVVVVAGMLFLDHSAAGALWPWLAAAIAIAVTGWIDDVRSLPTALRVPVHLLAGIGVVLAYGGFVGLSDVSFGLLAAPLTVLWIFGLTNAFNFMDGIDGIAGAQALVAGAAWAAIAWHSHDAVLLHAALLIAAASAGFLLHNWSPARIFMGDVGSTFLGFTLAVVPLFSAAGRRDALVPALIVWPFVFDSSFTFLRRLRKRENVFAAHRSHLYQRLTMAGWSHCRVALLYMAFAAAGGAAAVGVDRGELAPAAAIAAVVAFALGLWWMTVSVESRRRTAASLTP
jgi:UDP-N-acetylmuramyl pentapeptide phosphotransferase/UDP-N-acetylglucosamine-1-phosphate transferase